MSEIALYCFPKNIPVRLLKPNTKIFINYTTTKEGVFGEKQIRPNLSTKKILAISIQYHIVLVEKKYIEEWKV